MVASFVEKFAGALARLRGLFASPRRRYHPERHYMRGPGPALRRKLEV